LQINDGEKKEDCEKPVFEVYERIEPVWKKSVTNIVPKDIDFDTKEEAELRAAERIQKLRKLSFNINTSDPASDFDAVPAYIRQEKELSDTFASPENFYSKYTVKKDENEQARISTINTFLDGKQPD
jgi:cell division protein FtsZ